jgi:signal transduction histidine kinase
MWQHFRTLRFRLAALYLLVFGIILTILCVVILQFREHYLRTDFDERLIDRAGIMVEAIGVAAARRGDVPTPSRTSARLNPFRFPGYHFQILDVDGRVLERSHSLGERSLPFGAAARASRSQAAPVLETVTLELPGEGRDGPDGRASGINVEPRQFRLLTLYHDEPDVQPFFLQVAADPERMQSSIRQLRRLFAILVPACLLLAALASWLMARRSLAPIGEIARQARRYTAAHLNRRIATRPGGDEVAEMVSVINDMLDRLEAAFRAQERFVADASHELKTPLSVLLAEAQVVMQTARTSEEHDRYVTSVAEQLHQLSRLVDSLLTLARTEAGFPLASPAPVPVNEVVTEAVQRCERLASHREVRLIPKLALPTEEGLEPLVAGDAPLLCALVENLIRNAVRHSDVEQAVEIEVRLVPPNVIVAVRDHGPGIPPEHLGRVFDRFYHVRHGDQPGEGAGLGLAIAKSVAELHHGSISVANRVSGGCEFVVRLPLLAENRASP